MSMGEMPGGMTGDAREVWALAEQLGWEFVRKSRNNHFLLRHPVTGETTAMTPKLNRGAHAYKNTVAALRRGAQT